MNNTIIDTTKITRLEIINHKDDLGREGVKYFNPGQLEIQVQDSGRTLKLFLLK